MQFLWSGSGEPLVYMNERDCIKYLSDEIAYGKVLQVFNFLLDKLTEDQEKYKSWMEDPIYNSGKEKVRLQLLADILQEVDDNNV